MSTLHHLIAEAQGLAMDHPCAREHIWEAVGGKYCHACGGSKAVYECRRCGESDYGEREQCGWECDTAKDRWVQQQEPSNIELTGAAPHERE